MSPWRRAPLWLRLMTGVLLLATVALAVSGLAGGRLLHGYLVHQVDEQLFRAAAALQEEPALFEGPTQYYFAKFDSEGEPQGEPRPAWRSDEPLPEVGQITLQESQQRAGDPFTIHSTSGHGRWRAIALPYPEGIPNTVGRVPGTVVIASSLHEVDATVARLRAINTLVGIAVLSGLALAGYWIIRGALRPLVDMERTAGDIAGGDLARRMPDPDPGTEVGRLGYAFNTMLDHLEAAFRARERSEVHARASESRMRQFVADASHELRTPLTSIRGFAELYRQGALTDSDAVPDVFRRIEDEATRMGLLVDDLLLLARMDQERPLAAAPVDLAALVEEVVDATQAATPDRKVELTATERPRVIGDETRLRHVVSNLLDNALRYSAADTAVEVSVARTLRDDRDWAVLEVRDHGPGLTPEQAQRVFERFYRTDAARTRASGGAGLGLAIVAAIVAAHGGHPEVDSTAGEGATFRILLPLSTGRGPDPRPGPPATD